MPKLRNVKIGKLRRIQLQEIIDEAYDAGLSKKSLKNIRGAISLWLAYCRKRELTLLTSADIEIPKDAAVGERTILQPDELSILFSKEETIYKGKIINEWYVHAWRFATALGLRPGELIGIERRHIIDNRLHVRGAINSRGIHTKGKNENAIRDIVLHPIALKIVEDQLTMLRDADVVSKYLFPYKDGTASSQDTMSKAWKRYRDYHGIGPVTPYELRHTFVSVTAGLSSLNIGELRSVVGHSKNMDTLGTYAHSLNEAELRIASKIGDAYSSILKDH